MNNVIYFNYSNFKFFLFGITNAILSIFFPWFSSISVNVKNSCVSALGSAFSFLKESFSSTNKSQKSDGITLQISTSPVHLYYDSRDVPFIWQWCTTTRCRSLHLLYLYQSQCRCTTIQVHLISSAVHCVKYFTIQRRHVYIGKVHLFSQIF